MRKLGFILAVSALCAAAAAAAPPGERRSDRERGRADIGTAYQQVKHLDQLRLQRDPEYARKMIIHLNSIRYISDDDVEGAAWADMMRVLALIGMGQSEEGLKLGSAVAAAQPALPESYPAALLAALRAEKPMEGLKLLELAAANVTKPKALRSLQGMIPSNMAAHLLPRIEAAGGAGARARANRAFLTLGLTAK